MQLRDPIAEEEVNCCCWSELAIHAGYPTAKNEEQIGHGVPEGAPKEDYKLPMFVVAIVASSCHVSSSTISFFSKTSWPPFNHTFHAAP